MLIHCYFETLPQGLLSLMPRFISQSSTFAFGVVIILLASCSLHPFIRTSALFYGTAHLNFKIHIANRLLLLASKVHFHGTIFIFASFFQMGTSAAIQGVRINPKNTSYTLCKYIICPFNYKAVLSAQRKKKRVGSAKTNICFHS